MKLLRSFLIAGSLVFASSSTAGIYDDTFSAINTRDTGKLSELLRLGMDVNSTDTLGNSLLMLAAGNGDYATLTLLIKNGANVRTINRYGDSALMLSALRGHLTCVVALSDAGSEMDPAGWTPLIYASFEGHSEVVRFLLGKTVQVNAQAENGMTALMAASRNGHLEIVRTLLDHGADSLISTSTGVTASILAARSGHTAITEQLARRVIR